MRHYKIILLLLLITGFCSCSSPEPDLFMFNNIVTNNSSQAFTLTLSHPTEILYEERVESLNSNTFCSYNSEFFFGVDPACGSIITVEFDNGKGYRCDNSLVFVDDTLCFDNRGLLFRDGYVDEGNGNYRFTVTEEDFLNAKDL